jgi:hypothetical protein
MPRSACLIATCSSRSTSDGTPVTDLRPQEFVIREDGARREVCRLAAPTP